MLLVAAIDVSSGPAYDFGFFYLVAVVPAAWLLGRGPGIALALAAGFGWFFADIVEGRTEVIGAIAWNAASRMLLFLTAAWLVDLVRRDRERLRTLDRDRSHFLRVLEHELGGPGHELAARLHALRDAGGATATELQPLIERARRETGCVVTHGLGPRYLHSTGQLHKGGPNTGLFLQVIDDQGEELPIPGKPFGFARLIRAQAAGDFASLKERGRRVARIRLEEL